MWLLGLGVLFPSSDAPETVDLRIPPPLGEPPLIILPALLTCGMHFDPDAVPSLVRFTPLPNEPFLEIGFG